MTALCLWGALIGAPFAAQADDMPHRVVSMNLCTDQLAMLVAAEGQLISVSALASDPRSSAMAEVARAYPENRGLAEEIYLMQPDLVLAGRYTARASVDMLQRLGIRVEVFDLATTLEDVRGGLTRMGAVLGREEQAAALVADFDAGLAALREESGRHPRAALYHANGYTLGDNTLSGEILAAAGLANIAAGAGYSGGGNMPLEVLAMARPDAVITSRPYAGASRSEEIMDHPVVHALQRAGARGALSDQDWVCGTPYVLRAIEDMTALRRDILASAP